MGRFFSSPKTLTAYNFVGDTFLPILKAGPTGPLDPFKASKLQIGLKGRYFDENRNEAPLFYFNLVLRRNKYGTV